MTGAAALFAAATIWGAAVSVREDVPGEPFGVRTPGPVPLQLAAGLGSGLSAPWPMVAAVAVLGARHDDDRPQGRTAVVVGLLTVAGVLAEPVTWGRRSRSVGVASTVVLNVLAGAGLVATGRRARRRPSWPGCRSSDRDGVLNRVRRAPAGTRT